MCGISGWFLTEQSGFRYEHLKSMLRMLDHRGPDDSGIYYDQRKGLGLAHNRLSILDLSRNGHQPMVSDTTHDILVFNGEIYNFRELKKELLSLGYGFRSQTDTEVLLHAFAQWGIQCVTKVHGMFAFAFWSAATEVLYLVRDPMGIKPLYYWLLPSGKGLVFASEIKAFLSLPGFQREVDRGSLEQFLEFGYSYTEKTIFRSVFKLLPGHYLEIHAGNVEQPHRYFDLDVVPHGEIDREKVEKELYETLTEVVKDHMVADVPIGMLLSGGLDSSLLASIAARETRIKTFSMGFQSSVDERPFARLVSDYIGSDHSELEITQDEIIGDLEESMFFFDDIFADWGMISTRLLYKKCREQGIKVVIVGEGADELFGGYNVFRFSMPGGFWGPRDWRLFQLYRSYVGRRYGGQYPAFRLQMLEYLDATSGDWFSAIRLFESRNQLPNNYVMKVDKASMAVSVEARVPFLDARVAEIAYRVPGEQLLGSGSEKLLLRSMAERYRLLPNMILNRKKFGASIAASWMDDSIVFRSYARDVILDNSSWVDELGLRRAMVGYFDKGKAGYRFPRSISIFRNLAWRLLIVNLWSRSYLGSAYVG